MGRDSFWKIWQISKGPHASEKRSFTLSEIHLQSYFSHTFDMTHSVDSFGKNEGRGLSCYFNWWQTSQTGGKVEERMRKQTHRADQLSLPAHFLLNLWHTCQNSAVTRADMWYTLGFNTPQIHSELTLVSTFFIIIKLKSSQIQTFIFCAKTFSGFTHFIICLSSYHKFYGTISWLIKLLICNIPFSFRHIT